MISPSLKKKVSMTIFGSAIMKNKRFNHVFKIRQKEYSRTMMTNVEAVDVMREKRLYVYLKVIVQGIENVRPKRPYVICNQIGVKHVVQIPMSPMRLQMKPFQQIERVVH